MWGKIVTLVLRVMSFVLYGLLRFSPKIFQDGTKNCTSNQFVEWFRTRTRTRKRKEKSVKGSPGGAREDGSGCRMRSPRSALWRLKWLEEVSDALVKTFRYSSVKWFTSTRLIILTTAIDEDFIWVLSS